MIVVIGHGPSIVGKGLGPWIDQQTVIRLKSAPMPNPEDWGTRTDYVSTTKPDHWVCSPSIPGERWVFGHKTKGYRRPDVDRWLAYFGQFLGDKHRKPSNGLCAVFCAVEFLKPEKIGLIGFDSILHPERNTGKWWDSKPPKWSHDQKAENQALYGLGIEVIEC
jgi:hypothetical protein